MCKFSDSKSTSYSLVGSAGLLTAAVLKSALLLSEEPSASNSLVENTEIQNTLYLTLGLKNHKFEDMKIVMNNLNFKN